MMFDYANGWSLWDVAGMGLMMLAFWGVVAWVVYSAVTDRSLRRTYDPTSGTKEILDRRLAKGEIDDDEYRRVRELLNDENRVPVGRRQS